MSELVISCNKKIWEYLDKRLPLSALQGARRAGKTYTICQWLLLQAYNEGDRIIIASMTSEQGRKGAYEDCRTILDSWGAFGELFEITKAPRRIECQRTNTKSGRRGVIEFAVFDDPERAKGAACDWVFLNEANKFTKKQYLDLSANARKGVICDYNPNQHFWIETEIDSDKVLLCSWKDNAKHLTSSQIGWFEKLKENAEKPSASAADLYYYKVYYLNEYAELLGDVFTPSVIRRCELRDVPLSDLRRPIIFGDPSALVGNDFFPLTLSAMDSNGTIYILDADSVNEGGRAERMAAIERMLARLDNVRVFVESNGYIGQTFIEYARGEAYEKPSRALAVEPWFSKGDKFDRILSQYETIKERVVFVEQPRLQEYLKQVYEFSRTCEHDDNIDNIASVCRIHEFLK